MIAVTLLTKLYSMHQAANERCISVNLFLHILRVIGKVRGYAQVSSDLGRSGANCLSKMQKKEERRAMQRHKSQVDDGREEPTKRGAMSPHCPVPDVRGMQKCRKKNGSLDQRVLF